MSRERPMINSAASDEEAWHVRMRALGLAATPSCLSRTCGLIRVPLPLLSRLALGKIAELERPRRYAKAFGTTSTCCLGPLRASRVFAPTHVARKNCLQG